MRVLLQIYANICGLEKVPNPFVVLRYALHFALTCPYLPTYITCHFHHQTAVVISIYLLHLYRPRLVRIHGVQYSTQAVIRIKTPPQWSVKDPFICCKIETIFVYQDHKIFLMRALGIVRFSEHLKSFEVEDVSELLLVTYLDFHRSGVFHTKTRHEHYLIEKDHADVSF